MSALFDIVDLLAGELAEIKRTDGYNCDVVNVYRIPDSAMNMEREKTPCLFIAVGSPNVKAVEDYADIRFEASITITGYVKAAIVDLQEQITNLAADIRKKLYAPASLGSTALGIYFESEEYALGESIASVRQLWRLVYIESAAKGGAAAGNDIYGDYDIFQDVITKINAHLVELQTIMVSYSPTYSHVYIGHQKANLALNAVSFQITGADSGKTIGTTVGSAVYLYTFDVSIRVHTGYKGEHVNILETTRLVNSIVNYLNANINLADNTRIVEVGGFDPAKSFDDSGTVGAEFVIKVERIAQVTQV